jgi:VanZ family protein
MSEFKEPDRRRTPRAPRGLLARILAVAYLVVIAYTSLQPFGGWWIPPEEIRGFLWAPWPRYITLEDVVLNIAAYVPLGFLLARAFAAKVEMRRAVFVAAGLALLTSVAMECVQMFMPARVASNIDVLTNGLGGLLGALASPFFAPTRGLGIRLAKLREKWFAYGLAADVGIVLVSIWLVTQLHPNAQLFGTGDLRDTFNLPALGIHTPALLVATEAMVAGFNLIGVGLVLYALTRPTVPRGFAVSVVLGVGLAGKTLAAFAFARGAAPFAWATPGVLIGVLVSAVALFGLSRASRRTQWIVAGVSFAAAVAVINLAPENPYQTIPPQLLAGPTHMLSFSSIVRALSELWPFLAMIYTATVVREPVG